MGKNQQNNTENRQDLNQIDERRIDNIVDLAEKHTRTERNLEQHSDISSPENLAHIKEIQASREEEIGNLKNIIANGEHSNHDELENLKKRYAYTEGYLGHNADTMDETTLANTKEKQEHRKEQIDFLE